MKKKLLFGVAVLAITVVVAWNVSFSSQQRTMSDLSLANVEALALGEGGNGCCKWRTQEGCGGGWALCDCAGYGYDCTCGDAKWYPGA